MALPASVIAHERARYLVFAISADYERRTGGWIYDTRLMTELRGCGWLVSDMILPAGFPHPDAGARRTAAAQFDALADGTLVVADQLCLGVMPDVARRHAQRLWLVMIVHHPLSFDAGNSEDGAALATAERDALAHVARVIVTSQTTADYLRDRFRVPLDRIVLARPGIDPQPAVAPRNQVPSLLSVGAVVPRKDHATLVTAMAGLDHLPWHLTIVGNTTRAPEHVTHLQAIIDELRLAHRITLMGECDDVELERIWHAADVYVAASRHEGFGMAIAEAIARGIPVVTTSAGAVQEWLSRDAAVIVPPGDACALRTALGVLLAEPERRDTLRDGALAARSRLPRWQDTAATVDAALGRLIA